MTISEAADQVYHRGFVHVPTVVAVACVVYGASIVMHEGAHALTGWLVGGRPTLISTTDVRGDWTGVTALGMTVIGLSGSVVNWLVAAAAVLLFRRWSRARTSVRWMLWLALAVNGFIPAMYMIVSPWLGFGDWDTVLRHWPGSVAWRIIAGALGVGITWWWFQVAANKLNTIVGLAGDDRARFAGRLVFISWITGGVLGLLAALFSPLSLPWAIAVALGSTLGTTWPLLPIAELIAEEPPRSTVGGITHFGSHRGWQVAGIALALVFIALFGRGITLG